MNTPGEDVGWTPIRLDDGCCVCGVPALGTCSRCGKQVCSEHRIVLDSSLIGPGASGMLCPGCGDREQATRHLQGRFIPVPEGASLVASAFRLISGLVKGLTAEKP